MSNPLIMGKDLASVTLTVAASGYIATTAGGSGDNVAVTGLTIDRENIQSSGVSPSYDVLPSGAIFTVFYECALGATNTITLKNALLQDSADGTTWAPPARPSGVPSSSARIFGRAAATSASASRRTCPRGARTQVFLVGAILSGIDDLPAGVV